MNREPTAIEQMLIDQDTATRSHNPLNALMKNSYFSDEEVGIRHPTNYSFLRMKDDGQAEIYVGTHNGTRWDPNADSITDLAPKRNFWTPEFNVHTAPLGFTWNYQAMNPEFQRENFYLLGSYASWDEVNARTVYRDVKIKPFRPRPIPSGMSDEVRALLKNKLGLSV